MKLINYVLIGLMVILVMFGIEALTLQEQQHIQLQESYLDRVVSSASVDAVNTLKGAVTYDGQLRIKHKDMSLTIDNFINTIALSLGDNSILTKQMLLNYMPFAVAIDDEGYIILATATEDGEGQSFQKVLTPKIKFQHQIGDNIIYLNNNHLITALTLDRGDYEVKSQTRQAWINSSNRDIGTFLANANYEAVVERLKREQLLSDLHYYVNAHNAYASAHGIVYDFVFDDRLLEIDFDEVTFLVGFQGMPITAQKRYDKLINNGFKIAVEEPYIGFQQNGIPYYVRADAYDAFADDASTLTQFKTANEATLAGYFPYTSRP